MTQPAGLYRLYKAGSEEYQDFKEHERADMLADGWCDAPNSQPVEPETVEPSADPDWDKPDDGASEIAPETPGPASEG